MGFRPLPIGVDDFKTLISKGYYYVDKTCLIREVLEKMGEVTLFTRPRRFGKTLNMSMLKYYFENTGDRVLNEDNRSLFEGLKVMEAGDGVTAQMQQFPVISLSLKSARQPTFNLSLLSLKRQIAGEFGRHREILPQLGEKKERFQRILAEGEDDGDYIDSLAFLSECLYQCYGRKCIILIDEYDVPLENAYFEGFYAEITAFIRSLFESALKSNPYLEFAVLTGCLRISKESIFTGLNNLKIVSILNESYGEYFGFQQSEVDKMLEFYERSDSADIMKEWYDGYRFGNTDVYNPWSVICFVDALYANPSALPSPFWSNTSSNSIVKDLVGRSDLLVRDEMERLIAGDTIEKAVHEDITYEDIYESPDHLWNFLFFTGYLKQTGRRLEGETQYITMALPNAEVRYIYKNTILAWFRNEIKGKDLTGLYTAVLSGDEKTFEKELSARLQETISFMDSREAFYHGFVLGVLSKLNNYLVHSNREAGSGRYDILIRSLNVANPPVILELKVSDTYQGMDAACDRALAQIEDNHYDQELPAEGYTRVFHYGIAFYKKQCRIKARYKKLI